jgi:hypothetical protein
LPILAGKQLIERERVEAGMMAMRYGRISRVSLVIKIGILVNFSAPAVATAKPFAVVASNSVNSAPSHSEATLAEPTAAAPSAAESLDLDPALVEDSPVLERWLEEVPNVLSEIRRDPSFRTRLRFGYSQFPANEQAAGFNLGFEDAFIGNTSFTVSGDYQGTFNGARQAYGADLHYYVLPLGSAVNVAPVVGYRHIDTDRYATSGIRVGARLRIVPSRTGAADITLTQSWVAPGTDEEVGISTLSLGYAVTRELRISTDLEKQNAPARKDSRVGIALEWML